MKKGSSLLRLLTIFMTIIGLNVATLVGFILLYPTINGEFASHNSSVISSDITLVQGNDYKMEASLSANPTNNLSPKYSKEKNADNTSEPYPVTEYDPTKQSMFEELQDRNDYTNETFLQSENGVENTKDYVSDQMQQQSVETSILETERSPETLNNTKSISQPVAITESQSENFSTLDPEIQSPAPVEEKVWLSATGSKYHRINNCGNMNPNRATQVSLQYALDKHIDRCENCYSADTPDYSAMDNISSTQQDNAFSGQQDNDPLIEQNVTNYILTTDGYHEYFHLSKNCKFVISAGSYKPISGSKDELVSRGYIMCNCVELAQ